MHIIFLKFSHYLFPAPEGELACDDCKYSNAFCRKL